MNTQTQVRETINHTSISDWSAVASSSSSNDATTPACDDSTDKHEASLNRKITNLVWLGEGSAAHLLDGVGESAERSDLAQQQRILQYAHKRIREMRSS